MAVIGVSGARLDDENRIVPGGPQGRASAGLEDRRRAGSKVRGVDEGRIASPARGLDETRRRTMDRREAQIDGADGQPLRLLRGRDAAGDQDGDGR